MRLIALIAALGVATPAAAAEVELAALMLRMQIHMDKLYWAGKAKNWPLAAFYTHEIEETLEEITKAKIVEDGVNVSALAGPMLGGAVSTVENTIKAKTGFETAYVATVNACNGCHAAAKHPFIQIQVPLRPMFTNQKFTP